MAGDIEKKWGKKILAYSLKNALEHDGKALTNNVLNSLFHEGLEKTEIKNVIPLIQKTLKEINSLDIEQQKEKFSELANEVDHRQEREGLQELPNAIQGKVVLRLAPYPSGALHIGNAKTYLLNALYTEKYQGKLYLVIDDTIGSEEKQIVKEAYKLIPEAFDWLKVKYEKPIIYKSDRLEIYYKYAEELIKKGKAYVCKCSAKKLRENRAKSLDCPERKQTVEQTLREWKKMFQVRGYKEGQAVLRIKTSMQHENPAFRDRVLFRISERAHPRVARKYRVWPLLEFSWAIDDHLLGITHIIRGKDLMMESEMEKYIWNIFGWPSCELLHSGMVRLEGMQAKISKSKAQKEVLSGKFSSWSDPRTWSVQSLMLRGIQPEALRKFVEDIGLNQNDTTVALEILYSINRKFLHEIAKRFNFMKTMANEKSNVKVLMPDASIIKGKSNINIKKLKAELVHFTGFGYCKWNKKEKRFWFAHA